MTQFDRDKVQQATRFLWTVAVACFAFILASGWIVGVYAAVRIVSKW